MITKHFCQYELFKRYGNNLSAIPERSVLFNRAFDNLVSKQVEGCIYIGYHGREVSFSPPDTGLPFVYTYCVPKDKSYPYVLSDDENASLEIGRALISMGTGASALFPALSTASTHRSVL